jgi:hypothetical protein
MNGIPGKIQPRRGFALLARRALTQAGNCVSASLRLCVESIFPGGETRRGLSRNHRRQHPIHQPVGHHAHGYQPRPPSRQTKNEPSQRHDDPHRRGRARPRQGLHPSQEGIRRAKRVKGNVATRGLFAGIQNGNRAIFDALVLAAPDEGMEPLSGIRR